MTDPRAVVVRYVEAVRDGDADAVRASFTEDATWRYPGDLPISKVWRGRDAIVDGFLGGMAPVFVPGTVEIELVGTVAEGDRVVAEWTSKARTVHGAVYDNRCVGVFTVRGGLIAAVVEYTDTRHAAAVLFPGHGGSPSGGAAV
ncbi:nuclear transport factor 2 family protein [Actinomadura roseirufa]|uniref:nuclear transport factor 2 family protein n=1 Tax=Actinomadura roseirufa TaxID=2094049 RepID=UPI0010412294|nr:nuclear transport factor 2 family protein [Actinomadura roseirufa]